MTLSQMTRAKWLQLWSKTLYDSGCQLSLILPSIHSSSSASDRRRPEVEGHLGEVLEHVLHVATAHLDHIAGKYSVPYNRTPTCGIMGAA